MMPSVRWSETTSPIPDPRVSARSVRSRHAQHVLAEVSQDEVVVYWRDGIEAGFAELALDVVLDGEAIATVYGQTDVSRLPGRLGRQQLSHVGLRAALLAAVE